MTAVALQNFAVIVHIVCLCWISYHAIKSSAELIFAVSQYMLVSIQNYSKNKTDVLS